MWLHNLSDGAIWFSYMAIPAVLIYFVRRRQDVPFPKIFWMFGAFIVLCGLTHLVEIVMTVRPMYRFSGVVKLATAGVSISTLVALVPLIPVALALKSPKLLETVNGRLEAEIAERKKVQEELARRNAELREKEDFARSVTEAASDAIICADDAGSIVSWNRGAEHIFGYTSAEAVGKPLTLLMPERYREAHFRGMERLRGGEASRVLGKRLELEGVRKDGTEFPMELCVDGWTAGGRRFFTGIIRDVADRKLRDQEILQLNRELEAFSYSVSHDLRAPLRAVIGYSKMLVEDHTTTLDGEGKRLAGVVSRSALRMGQLIDALLEFSRLGRTEVRSARLDLVPLVREAFRELLEEAGQRRVETQVRDLPAACGDRTLLKQVILNLLGNALKYSRTRDLATIEVGGSSDGKECTYWVRDNGVGFDMQYAPKLFGVFQRLHSPEAFEGTGVGLALVQRVIHRHGGRVWAEAAVDRGATFYFTLPAGRGGSDGGA